MKLSLKAHLWAYLQATFQGFCICILSKKEVNIHSEFDGFCILPIRATNEEVNALSKHALVWKWKTGPYISSFRTFKHDLMNVKWKPPELGLLFPSQLHTTSTTSSKEKGEERKSGSSDVILLNLMPSKVGLLKSSSWNRFSKWFLTSSFISSTSSSHWLPTLRDTCWLHLCLYLMELWKNPVFPSPSLIHLVLAFWSSKLYLLWSAFRNSVDRHVIQWLSLDLHLATNESTKFISFTVSSIFRSMYPNTSLFHTFNFSFNNFNFSLTTKAIHPSISKDFHEFSIKALPSLCSSQSLVNLKVWVPNLCLTISTKPGNGQKYP